MQIDYRLNGATPFILGAIYILVWQLLQFLEMRYLPLSDLLLGVMDYYSSSIIELCYVSRADCDLSQKTVLRLIDQSRAWNEQHDVTSILFYNDGYFCQILEGTLRNLDLVCRRIWGSPLHSRIKHLETRAISKRSMPYAAFQFFSQGVTCEQFPELSIEMTRADYDRIALTRAIRAAANAVCGNPGSSHVQSEEVEMV